MSVRKIHDEMKETVLAEQTTWHEFENDEEELWHRKKVHFVALCVAISKALI